MEAANIKGDDVETFVKAIQLMGSFAQGYYKYEFDLKNIGYPEKYTAAFEDKLVAEQQK